VAAWIAGLSLFFGLVFALFFVITRGTRVILGSRRRLEEELGLEVLRKRHARGEISQAEFEQANRARRLTGHQARACHASAGSARPDDTGGGVATEAVARLVTGHSRFGLGHSGVVALVGSSPEARS